VEQSLAGGRILQVEEPRRVLGDVPVEVRDIDVDVLDDKERLSVVRGRVLERDVKGNSLVVKRNVKETLVPERQEKESMK
jgi:hypothetical protein